MVIGVKEVTTVNWNTYVNRVSVRARLFEMSVFEKVKMVNDDVNEKKITERSTFLHPEFSLMHLEDMKFT